MDFAPVLAAAKRAQAAYVMDPAQAKKAFEALGHEFIGQFKDSDSQAVVSRDTAGKVYLSISGTRFGKSLGDLADDLYFRPVDVGGASVSFGGYDGLIDVWKWAKNLVPADTVWNVEGHSLGGQRALYSPLYLAKDQIGAIHAFESPKGADSRFWVKYADPLKAAVHTVNAADIWYGYPWLSPYSHPDADVIWLKDSGYSIIKPTQWRRGFSLDDHSIDLVVNRLQAIVGSGVPA
jgi:hypothetical protein